MLLYETVDGCTVGLPVLPMAGARVARQHLSPARRQCRYLAHAAVPRNDSFAGIRGRILAPLAADQRERAGIPEFGRAQFVEGAVLVTLRRLQAAVEQVMQRILITAT